MATETITGCVDFSDGSISFVQQEWCGDGECGYTGCMIFDGIHAGQVSITVSSFRCDDIYYGCVDFLTGEFNVILPDVCCEDCIPEYHGTDCSVCSNFSANETPRFITAFVTGVIDCSDDSVIDDFTICLEISTASGSFCSWEGVCIPVDYPVEASLITVSIKTSSIDFSINWWKSDQPLGNKILFRYNDATSCPSDVFNTAHSSVLTSGNCGAVFIGYSGTVTLTNLGG